MGMFSNEPGARYEGPSRKPQVSLSDFRILDFNACGPKNPTVEWPGREKVFLLEGCARQLFAGHTLDFDLPPDIQLRARRDLRAGAAYEFLVRVATGLESNVQGEYHVLGDIKRRWGDYEQRAASGDRSLSKIMNWCFEDTKALRANVLSDLRKISPERSVVRLLELSGGETILVVADKFGTTLDILRALGRDNQKRAGEIWITHPDSRELDSRMLELQEAIAAKIIVSKVSPMAMTDALEFGFGLCDHAVICQPMFNPSDPNTIGNSELDSRIIKAWRARSDSKGFLVHLRGDPLSRKGTTGAWLDLDQNTFIRPERIVEHFTAQRAWNEDVVRRASLACLNCTRSRELGLRPIFDQIDRTPAEYRLLIEGALPGAPGD